MNPKNIFQIVVVLLLATSITNVNLCLSQNMKVISKTSVYKKQVHSDSNFKMVELRRLIPSLRYDLLYATANNFTKQSLYKNGSTTFLRLPVAKALLKVQSELEKQNLSLKIFDAYRPYSVTKKMWTLIKDERYVANPAKGSNHNRGLAIDLTLVDLVTGKEQQMGTAFDNFTDTAHHKFRDLPKLVLDNRQLLKKIMEQHGFIALETEWWHYSWVNNLGYDVLDLPFQNLQ